MRGYRWSKFSSIHGLSSIWASRVKYLQRIPRLTLFLNLLHYQPRLLWLTYLSEPNQFPIERHTHIIYIYTLGRDRHLICSCKLYLHYPLFSLCAVLFNSIQYMYTTLHAEMMWMSVQDICRKGSKTGTTPFPSPMNGPRHGLRLVSFIIFQSVKQKWHT